MSRVVYLAGIIFLVWFSLIVGMWIIKLIVPLTLPWHGIYVNAALAVAKILVGLLMVGLWLYIWKFVSDTYFAKAMKKRGLQLK